MERERERERTLIIFIFLEMFFIQLVLFCCLIIFSLLIQQNGMSHSLIQWYIFYLAKVRIVFLFSSLEPIFSKTEHQSFFFVSLITTPRANELIL